jgi:hypothetical protein
LSKTEATLVIVIFTSLCFSANARLASDINGISITKFFSAWASLEKTSKQILRDASLDMKSTT